MTDSIGRYNCPSCGHVEITDASKILITYPKGYGKEGPFVEICCENCSFGFSGFVDWEDALIFDFNGAAVKGFSFRNGPSLTEEDIDSFVERMDDEVEEFLDSSAVE